MAGGSDFWLPLLLCCLFQASSNEEVKTFTGLGGLDPDILSKIPIQLPEGIDARNISVTSIVVKSCTGLKEQLALLNSQLQQTILRNSQLNNEAFELRSDVRLLKIQLTACSSTASAITGSYQTQLLQKMKQLLGTFDSNTFLILNIIGLNREVNILMKRIKSAANSTADEIDLLHRELQEKTVELTQKTAQIEENLPNAALILQVISLQNQIWDLEQANSRTPTGEIRIQLEKRILVLQSQLSTKISQLSGTGSPEASVLELISVKNKISFTQTVLSIIIEESRVNTAEFQLQLKEKYELLKSLIMKLNDDKHNSGLTTEILKLQGQVHQLSLLITNAKKTSDAKIKELRAVLELEKARQELLQKQLEDVDYSQSQIIFKIIDVMKEVRELEGDEQQQTTTTSGTTLQALLEAKSRGFAKAQAEIEELQKKLRQKTQECSGLQDRYEQAQTEFEKKIAALNRSGDTQTTLIFNLINLQNELRVLREQISLTEDPDKISELHQILEQKQDELFSKITDIGSQTANGQIILSIITLQEEIWNLQREAANQTDANRIKEMQTKVDNLIGQLDDNGNGNIKLTLKILTLQSQVEQLEKYLSSVQTLTDDQVTQLRNDLAAKGAELQVNIRDLKQKDEDNARLILEVTELHKQLRELQGQRDDDSSASSSAITQLKEQLKAKMEQQARDQSTIESLRAQLQVKEKEFTKLQNEFAELQTKLQQKSAECSGFEERYQEAKSEFDKKIEELNQRGESQAALILNLINLQGEVKMLKELIATTDNQDKITELQRQLEEKQKDLTAKTADIERLISNPTAILTIITLQEEIWNFQRQAANETDANRIKEMQTKVDNLIEQLDTQNDGHIKLILRLITLQSQVDQLQRQLLDIQNKHTTEENQLVNDLIAKKKQLKTYISELTQSNQANAQLILEISGLQEQFRNLEQEKDNEGQTASATITKLRKQLEGLLEVRTQDHTEIEALKNQLSETGERCSGSEKRVEDLQTELDSKITELQSQSNTVTSLTLQISMITAQLEERKRELEKAVSEDKIKELQKIIDEKDAELARKTQELKERSGQPQRILQIIAIQTEIEKLSFVTVNETVNQFKIQALQQQLNRLIGGVQDDKDENTKLAYQNEITRLKKQHQAETMADLEKISDLENELENIRREIQRKMRILDSSDTRIANLSAQIMELHVKIQPLESQITSLKEASAAKLGEFKKRLDLSRRQLEDTELQLQEADRANYQSIIDIANLRQKLQEAQRQAESAAQESTRDLEEELNRQKRENKKLESANEDLKQDVEELRLCCSDSQCDDLRRKVQESDDDMDRLQKQLHEKQTTVQSLRLEIDEQIRQKDKLQEAYNNLLAKLTDVEDKTIHPREVTFDPDTANQRLVITAADHDVAISQRIQHTRDHPERYDVILAALAKTGYSSGRQYWEVSVAEKSCFHLGMASESAQRRGSIIFKPSTGYWTIILNKQGQYRALEESSFTPIVVRRSPTTLGIFLDYKNGHVSFYDVATREHLYSFARQTFRDKIYPFVNLCVEDSASQIPIVLLTPGSVDWIE